MLNLQETLLNWYYTRFTKGVGKSLSTPSLMLFYTHQLIMTIVIGTILSLLWLLTPFILMLELLMSLMRKMLLVKHSYTTVQESEPDTAPSKLKVILDLDNTLVFSSMQKLEKLRNFLRIDDNLYVYKRPHLESFLSTLAEFCDLAVYTSSTQEYADKILHYIDKSHLIKERFYRHNCVPFNNILYKDVLKLKFNEKKMLIIDDNPKCYLNMKENIIQIKFWKGDERDDSLLKIKNIIRNYYYCGGFNVSDIIRSTWTSEV